MKHTYQLRTIRETEKNNFVFILYRDDRMPDDDLDNDGSGLTEPERDSEPRESKNPQNITLRLQSLRRIP